MTTEFRKYGRSPLYGQIKLKHRDLGEFYAEGGDISATGIFLRLPRERPVAIGDEVAALLPEALQQLPGEARLRVVRITSEGIGLTFL